MVHVCDQSLAQLARKWAPPRTPIGDNCGLQCFAFLISHARDAASHPLDLLDVSRRGHTSSSVKSISLTSSRRSPPHPTFAARMYGLILGPVARSGDRWRPNLSSPSSSTLAQHHPSG